MLDSCWTLSHDAHGHGTIMMSLDRDAGGVVTCPANLMDWEICKRRPVQRTADLRAIFREEDSYTKPCIAHHQ